MCTLLSEHHSELSTLLSLFFYLPLLPPSLSRHATKSQASFLSPPPTPSITSAVCCWRISYCLRFPPFPFKLVWILIVWSCLINKTNAVRNSWLPHFINKWLVCHAPQWLIGCARDVLEPDEFNTVGVTGELQSISTHEKLRSKENVKKKKKKKESERCWKERRNKFRTDVFCLFASSSSQKQQQESQWWITEKSEKMCFNLWPCFPSLLSLRVVDSYRLWRGPWARSQGPDEEAGSQAEDNQTTEAGVQKPSSPLDRGASRALLYEYLSPVLLVFNTSALTMTVIRNPPMSEDKFVCLCLGAVCLDTHKGVCFL